MRFATPFIVAAGLMVAVAATAKTAPADAPAGSTALCKDGTYFSGAEKSGACSGHKGIKDWYGAETAKSDAKPAANADAKALADAKAEAKAKAKAEAKEKAEAKAKAKAEAKAKAAAAKAEAKEKAAAAKNGAATAATTAAAGAAGAAAATTTAPAPAAKPVAADKGKTPPASPDTITAAPGGGAGLVWVNESSKVYHCQGDRWYGKTKQGAYVTEADAKAKGFKADHGQACAK